ncbi:hypothetical protein [Escherichia coli]|nr:hypothetical protein [Escherichia coli]
MKRNDKILYYEGLN